MRPPHGQQYKRSLKRVRWMMCGISVCRSTSVFGFGLHSIDINKYTFSLPFHSLFLVTEYINARTDNYIIKLNIDVSPE